MIEKSYYFIYGGRSNARPLSSGLCPFGWPRPSRYSRSIGHAVQSSRSKSLANIQKTCKATYFLHKEWDNTPTAGHRAQTKTKVATRKPNNQGCTG